MRHLKKGRKLNRSSAHRSALFRNMATSLLQHERIETTEAKAKELRGYTERLITLAKRGDLHAKRLVFRKIRDRDVLAKLFDDVAVRYKGRPGGYTRVTRLYVRKGDNAVMAAIELVGNEVAAGAGAGDED